MELKLRNIEYGVQMVLGSNCTFMELKCVLPKWEGAWAKCSNCTFMELK